MGQSPAARSANPSIWLHRYSLFTAGFTFFLLIAGGLVTSTDSGLAVPDWPLSYGMWFPPMVGGIFYEHGHRMIAATTGLLILILAVWLWRTEPRPLLRRLGFAALAGVIIQGLLGGLTVVLLLPPQISIAHACLGQTVFCLVVCIAAAGSPRWNERQARFIDPAIPPLHVLALGMAAAAALQLLLGAIVRHTGYFLEWHMAVAGLVIAGAWLVSRRTRSAGVPEALRVDGRRLGWLVAAQAGLGIASLWLRHAVPVVTAHVAIGALVLAASVVLAWQAARSTRPQDPEWASSVRRRLADYAELTKPRLSLLVLVIAAAGFWLGLESPDRLGLLLPLLAGTAAVVGGANALNQWSERDYDAQMRRTQQRPLPARRLAPESARRFGWALIVSGVLLLAAAVNWLSAAVATLSAISYVLMYTPLKRRTTLNTLVGAVPGALPPVLGWAGARGSLGLEAWSLFLILFVWQLPHFLAIAVLYREDYARAGFRMLAVAETGEWMTARQTVWYGLVLIPVSLFPSFVGLGSQWYSYGALLLSVLFLWTALAAAFKRTPAACRLLFRASLAYLPLLFGLLVTDVSVKGQAIAEAEAAAAQESQLPDFGRLPEFSLVDQNGQPLSRGGIEGYVWVSGFIFTRCSGQCALMASRLLALQDAAPEGKRFGILAFSVDPEYDTPQVLTEFALRIGASARWRLVTGGEKEMIDLAQKGFRLSAVSGDPEDAPITHSAKLALLDAGARIRGYYDSEDPEAMARLRRDIAVLLEQP